MGVARESLTLDQLDFVVGFMGGAIDFTPALKGAQQIVIAETKENFDGEHTPDGTPWPPLKRPRMKGRGKKRRPKSPIGVDKILSDTGFLRSSVTAFGRYLRASASASAPFCATSTLKPWACAPSTSLRA